MTERQRSEKEILNHALNNEHFTANLTYLDEPRRRRYSQSSRPAQPVNYQTQPRFPPNARLKVTTVKRGTESTVRIFDKKGYLKSQERRTRTDEIEKIKRIPWWHFW